MTDFTRISLPSKYINKLKLKAISLNHKDDGIEKKLFKKGQCNKNDYYNNDNNDFNHIEENNNMNNTNNNPNETLNSNNDKKISIVTLLKDNDNNSKISSIPFPAEINNAVSGISSISNKLKENIIIIKPKDDKENINNNDNNDDVTFFGMNLSHFPVFFQFIILSAFCFLGFVFCGYIEEFIFRIEDFHFGWFVTSFELFFFVMITSIGYVWNDIPLYISLLIRYILRQKSTGINGHSFSNIIKDKLVKSPWQVHIIIGCAMTASRSLTLFSLLHLNYPTQVVFKSMKLLAVLIGSFCCFCKRYTFVEIFGHISMVAAACLFSLGDKEAESRFTFIGVVLVLSSLVADSIHANYQEYAMKAKRVNASELMIYSNTIASILSLIACIISNELRPAIIFCSKHYFIVMLLLMRNMAIYIGAVAYLALTKRFGAVIASEITTARKVLTITISYYIFPKPFIFKHQIGSMAFFVSIFFTFYAARAKSNTQKN